VVLNVTATGGFIDIFGPNESGTHVAKTYCLEIGKPDVDGNVSITPRLELEPVS